MSEMVDRGVQALKEAGWHPGCRPITSRENVEQIVRVVINAMREPTTAMEQVGTETNRQFSHDRGNDNPSRLASVTIPIGPTYQAMIDEALR